jgi:hypothetical protein
MGSTTTYLIDKCGKQIKTWPYDYKPGPLFITGWSLLRPGNANNVTTPEGKGRY